MTPPFTVVVMQHVSEYPQVCPTLAEAVWCAHYIGEEVDCWVKAICDSTGAVVYQHEVGRWVAQDAAAPPFAEVLRMGKG